MLDERNVQEGFTRQAVMSNQVAGTFSSIRRLNRRKETAMGLALFSMAMFIAMVAATINALRDETRDRATVLLPVAARRRRNQSNHHRLPR
ncbi:hypothetical protein CN180_26975 [Sinorhizobium medicae]|nr:hypothetical protein CN180_26975 [Sinorhizobium medicae]